MSISAHAIVELLVEYRTYSSLAAARTHAGHAPATNLVLEQDLLIADVPVQDCLLGVRLEQV